MITLCHAFKHRDVPMKDLNDLYLMMQKRELDYEYILQRIQLYGLEFYAQCFSDLFLIIMILMRLPLP